MGKEQAKGELWVFAIKLQSKAEQSQCFHSTWSPAHLALQTGMKIGYFAAGLLKCFPSEEIGDIALLKSKSLPAPFLRGDGF